MIYQNPPTCIPHSFPIRLPRPLAEGWRTGPHSRKFDLIQEIDPDVGWPSCTIVSYIEDGLVQTTGRAGFVPVGDSEDYLGLSLGQYVVFCFGLGLGSKVELFIKFFCSLMRVCRCVCLCYLYSIDSFVWGVFFSGRWDLRMKFEAMIFEI